MGHSFYAVYEHMVWGTKNREEFFDDALEKELSAYLATAVHTGACQPIDIGGHRNHVHLLVRKDKNVLTPNLIKELKRTSSIWLKTKGPSLTSFRWQEGYGAFSVSYSNLSRVRSYIRQQHQHHQQRSWEDEFRALLRRHGIAVDERYLWL